MYKNRFAIVCEGKEIAYGINLLHLFQFINDVEVFSSDVGSGCIVEIYSVAALKHANISKNAIKIYVGEIQKPDLSYRKVFSKYGMNIFISVDGFLLKEDDIKLSGGDYDSFILYANKRSQEYVDLEKNYIDRIGNVDHSWVTKDFQKVSRKGLLDIKSTSKAITLQQYDCLAFVLYLDYLAKDEM